MSDLLKLLVSRKAVGFSVIGLFISLFIIYQCISYLNKLYTAKLQEAGMTTQKNMQDELDTLERKINDNSNEDKYIKVVHPTNTAKYDSLNAKFKKRN